MQTFNGITNGETGLSVRGKLNNTLTAIISGSEGINAIWEKINSILQRVNGGEGGIGGLVKDTTYDPSSLDPDSSALLIALCTGTFYNLKDVNGLPITISGSNAITIFYRAANTTYWEYDTQEIFPAVDSYENTDYTKIEGANTHILTHGGTAIKPITDFDSVYDNKGNDLTKTFSRINAVARGTISAIELDTTLNSGLYLVTYDGESGEPDPRSMGLLEVFCTSGDNNITHQRLICNLDDPNSGYYVHSDDKKEKVWTRRCTITASSRTWSQWELIENFTPGLLKKLNDIEEGAQVNHTLVSDVGNSDFGVSDENGNVILHLKNGHIKTQKFNSETYGQTSIEDGENTDLDISDEQGNAIAHFSGGEFRTKNFNSLKTPTQTEDDSPAELKISDPYGNVIAEFRGGHFRTKEFDSRNTSGVGAKVIKDDTGRNILVL